MLVVGGFERSLAVLPIPAVGADVVAVVFLAKALLLANVYLLVVTNIGFCPGLQLYVLVVKVIRIMNVLLNPKECCIKAIFKRLRRVQALIEPEQIHLRKVADIPKVCEWLHPLHYHGGETRVLVTCFA
jgi:hypothetical protein